MSDLQSPAEFPMELIALITQKKQALQSLLEKEASKMAALKNTRILVLAEEQNMGDSLADYLKWKGFEQVSVKVPSDGGMTDCDLAVFHREDGTRGYEVLSDEFVSDYVQDHCDSQALLYFGTYNPRLNVLNAKIIFANYRHKLPGNILDMLEDIEYERKA